MDHAHKPDCSEALQEIYGLLSGEITEEVRVRITAHLELCPPCAEPYDFYGELRRLVQQRCRDQAPPQLLSRVEAALRSESS